MQRIQETIDDTRLPAWAREAADNGCLIDTLLSKIDLGEPETADPVVTTGDPENDPLEKPKAKAKKKAKASESADD